MLRLTVLLCAALFVTLLIGGDDKGQMRPGLARAIAAGEEITVIERRWTPVAEVVPAVAEAPEAIAPTPAVAPAEPVEVAMAPPPEPVANAPEVNPEPVFTLSALPTVTMETEAPVAEEPAVAAASGDIWYVTAGSVNVREGPSTDTSVVDKLTRGEAVAVSFEPGSEWALVTIEGDGTQGYVALRFLSPEAP